MQNEFWYYHNDYIIGLSFLIDFITYKKYSYNSALHQLCNSLTQNYEIFIPVTFRF